MSSVAQGWLVYSLTGSAFALGWVSAGWSISTLILSVFGGAIADRIEKRRLLLYSRLVMVINSLVIALLISFDVIQIWHLAASSLLIGICFAFMMPAQQAIVVDLVGRETLLNAVSLNAVGMGLMGIFCGVLAGMLIESVGVASVYYLTAGLYVMAVYSVTKLPNTRTGDTHSTSVWQDVVAGVRYLRARPTLLALLGLTLVRVLFGMPYRRLLPKFAQDNLGFDASGLGLLTSAPGIGSLVAALVLTSKGTMNGKSKLLIGAGVAMGVSLILFAALPYMGTIFGFLILLGAFGNVCMVMNNTLLQIHTDEGYRGRVMSVYMMLWGLTPFGTIPAGAIADIVGVPPVIIVQGIVTILLFVGAALVRPEIRRMD